jgi:long-subunit acyl-CoA synthetase (AMP-forming)|eukprot:COSAG01_NODE_3191_length_6436_cov_14.338646_2_plen_112_part_00
MLRHIRRHRRRRHSWQTYGEVYEQVQSAAKGLMSLEGVAEGARAKKSAGSEYIVALLAETSAEWQISAQAAFAAGLTITTVYATLGHEAMLHGLCVHAFCVCVHTGFESPQ